jgi:predicted permease
MLRYQPGLALAATLALSIGIGATTSMFSIVHGGLRPLPFEDPHEIVALQQTVRFEGGGMGIDVGLQPDDFRSWSERLTTLEAVGGFEARSMNLSGDSRDPARIDGVAVTSNAFPITGAQAAIGRTLLPADDDPAAQPAVVLSDRLWRTRYAADAGILGHTIRVDDAPYTVVGVMPPGYGFPIRAKLWIPLASAGAAGSSDARDIHAFGRLRDGVSADDATRELNLLLGQLASASPSTHANRSGMAVPFTELETPRETQVVLSILLGAVSLILIVACANVANLLLARAVSRSRESAIRSALGATRRQLVLRFLRESAIYAAAATVIGLGIAWLAIGFFAAASAQVLDAFWMQFRIDWTVVAAASVLGLVATVAAGLGPAFRASRADVTTLLREAGDRAGTPRTARLSRALVVGQVALACGFLCVTSTFVRAAVAMRNVEFPLDTTRVLTAQLAYRPDQLADPAARAEELRRLRDAIEATPGVRQSAFTSAFPGRGGGNWTVRFADVADAPRFVTNVMLVTPEFFPLMNAGAVRGRLFDWSDDARREPVAIVNQSFVRRFSPDRDPLGRRLRFAERNVTIAGVVPDLQIQDVDSRDAAGFYVSMLQFRPFAFRLMAAGEGDPLQMTPAIRTAVGTVNAGVPIEEVLTLREAIYQDKQILEAFALLFLLFGAGAIFLAMVGLHGVLAFAVTARTREFGVRLALGAGPRDLARVVIRFGAPSIAVGLGLGLALAFGLSQALGATIEALPPAGVSLYLALAAAVLAGSVGAIAWPLARVLRLNAVQALSQG